MQSNEHSLSNDIDERGKTPGKDEVTVHVLHVGEVENENFKVSPRATLQHIWDKAYDELKVDKQPRDAFQAVEGEGPNKKATDLMPHLHLTLEQAIAQGLTKTRHFEIIAATGGA